MPRIPFSVIAAEMIAWGATFEDVGQCAVATLREAFLGPLEQAHDRTTLGKALEVSSEAMADVSHDLMLYSGTLSSEQKQAYLNGIRKANVRPKVPSILKELEDEFSGGEKAALFTAIRVCAEFNYILPEWVAAAFMKGYAAVERLEVGHSWDAAFGRPKVKGQRLPEARKRRELIGQVEHRVDVLRRAKRGQSLEWIYGEVAADLNVNIKMVRELYNQAQKERPKHGLERWRHVVRSKVRPRRDALTAIFLVSGSR